MLYEIKYKPKENGEYDISENILGLFAERSTAVSNMWQQRREYTENGWNYIRSDSHLELKDDGRFVVCKDSKDIFRYRKESEFCEICIKDVDVEENLFNRIFVPKIWVVYRVKQNIEENRSKIKSVDIFYSYEKAQKEIRHRREKYLKKKGYELIRNKKKDIKPDDLQFSCKKDNKINEIHMVCMYMRGEGVYR